MIKVDNINLDTGVMKLGGELVGFYEQEFHKEKNEPPDRNSIPSKRK